MDEELRHLITKNHPTFKNYPPNTRWDLGAYGDETPQSTKITYQM